MKSTLALAFAAVLLCPGSSRADSAAESIDFDVKEARERFTRGVELYREGSFDAALAEFSKAYELAPNYRVLYNLAQVQAERHDYVAAFKLLEQYLEQGGNEIGAERLAEVDSAMTELRSRVAVLWVHSSIPSAELLVDGMSVGTLPMGSPMLLSAGVHQLQLRNPGDTTITHSLTIAGSETIRLELPQPSERTAAPPPAAPAEAPVNLRVRSEALKPPDPEPHSEPPPKTDRAASAPTGAPMWISLISTAVLAGGAVTFGALAHASDDELGRELARVPAERSRVADVRTALERNAALCDVLTAGALVAAGISVYFALSASSSDAPAARVARGAPRLTAAPAVRSHAFGPNRTALTLF